MCSKICARDNAEASVCWCLCWQWRRMPGKKYLFHTLPDRQYENLPFLSWWSTETGRLWWTADASTWQRSLGGRRCRLVGYWLRQPQSAGYLHKGQCLPRLDLCQHCILSDEMEKLQSFLDEFWIKAKDWSNEKSQCDSPINFSIPSITFKRCVIVMRVWAWKPWQMKSYVYFFFFENDVTLFW